MQHFANNFITKSAGDISDFGIKLIDDNNMETESADGKKKFPHRKLFDWIFSINRINRKRQQKADTLVETENDFQVSNFQIIIQKKVKTIQE